MNGDAGIVTDERAADERYRAALRLGDRDRKPVHHNDQRGASAASAGPARHVRGLLGRVALAEPTDFFDGTDFYIGSRYHVDDGLTVFSWAAPIASTFFQSWKQHELCSQVTARRTFLRRRGEIAGYVDDDGAVTGSGQPFAPRKLMIPKAPSRRQLPGRTAPRPSIPQQRTASDRAERGVPSRERTTPRPAAENDVSLRAERAVLAAISAPRQERLTSVLATLQPDQYELVTAGSDGALVIEGHPGTGKTVIAAHRAAYLVHEENKDRRRRVLIVGPTEHYVDHVRGVLAELVERPGAVEVLSVERVLRDVRGIGVQLDNSQPDRPFDVDDELGHLAERAVHMLRAAGHLENRSPQARGVEMVYEALRANHVGRYHLTRHPAQAAYLRSLPNHRTAKMMRRYLPLLAACGMAVGETRPESFDHVIIDEAQDLTPLEWSVLRSVNSTGSWTLLGDLNQRRSDLSCSGWDAVASVLETEDLRVVSLGRGYRTTAEIMDFAARLLPPSERTVASLQQGGAPPRVERERSSNLSSRVAKETAQLLERHAQGTVAIIGTKPQESIRALRRDGFTTDALRSDTMSFGDGSVRVLTPQEARGLEFDAVIVVEPIDFPSRIGSHGLLYTSLTRANKELIVIHSGRLQKELRERTPRAGSPRVGPSVPAPKVSAPDRSVRLLITGAQDWDDADAVREMLDFALSVYGGSSGASLLTFGDEGAEAIARRLWLSAPDGRTSPSVLEANCERDGWAARNNAIKGLIDRDTAPTAVLGFVQESASGRVRAVMKFAAEAEIPTWRWSKRLGFPVPARKQIRTELWHRVIRQTLPEIIASELAVQQRALSLSTSAFCDEMEEFDLASRVASDIHQAELLRQLLGNVHHRRRINRDVAVVAWGKARNVARVKAPLFLSV